MEGVEEEDMCIYTAVVNGPAAVVGGVEETRGRGELLPFAIEEG
jgi:hypothetical protein